MPKIGYDISNIEKVCSTIISSDTFPSAEMLTELKKEINTFFSEANCIDIIYTNNTDKLFFGVVAMPVFDHDSIIKIIMDTETVNVKEYYLEIDSKLLSANLDPKELTAYLLYQIWHLISVDSVNNVRNAIDIYMSLTDKTINLKSSAQYTQILSFGIKDTIMKLQSILYKSDEEFMNDRFMTETNYLTSIVTCMEKLQNAPIGFSSITREPRLNILEWVFNLYSDVKTKRIPAIDTLNTAKQFSGSMLIRKEIDNVLISLNRIDTDVQLEGACLEAATKKKGLVNQIRTSGLKGIENDLCEFKIRIKNLETEEEAMYVLRQINARLALLEDALEDLNMDDKEYDKWYNVLEQYRNLREDLSSKSIWNKKRYGIWYDYNTL